ncbi:MAG: PAS domain-containing protein [Pseudomonadales bacterium]
MRHTLEQLSHNIKQPVVVTDPLGQVLWVNEEFTRMCGHRTSDLLGKTPGSILQGPDTSADTVASIRAAVHHQESFNGTILNYHADGHPYWVYLNISPLKDRDGKLQYFMAIEREVPGPSSAMTTICMYCKNYKDPASGTWISYEKFLTAILHNPLSHGICPECAHKALQE